MAINAGIITFVSLVLPSVHGCVAPPYDPGPSADPTASSHNRSPASAVVVASILALLSLAIGLSSIYIRRCTDSPPPPLPIAAISTTASRFSSTVGAVLSFPSRHHDLDPLGLDMLPTVAYGEAKGREDWIGRVEECAVCLSEFEEPDTLRLLPRCGHAFHAPCIDKWLAKHVGCPVCRSTVAGDR